MLGRVASFGRFWYHFIVGDDWTLAASVVAGLAVVYALFRLGHPAWWLMPPVVLAALSASLWRATARS